MSEGAPAAKMAASGPSSLIALPSPRRGTGRGRTVAHGAGRQWTHGRTHASPEEVLCCMPPSSFSSPAHYLNSSVHGTTLLSTTRSLDVLAAAPCPVARARRPCASAPTLRALGG